MSGSVLETLLGERAAASVSALVAGALVVLLLATFPARDRSRVAGPMVLWLLSLGPLALAFVLPASLAAARPLALLSLLLSLLCLGRAVFLVLVDTLLARRLTKPPNSRVSWAISMRVSSSPVWI